ncbi:AT-hook motif nuclear-localized protein 11-like [Curcuma longa]|uniref:AT-hook motif nuclear-localized protein 11-like n=1 Tax=Curcuma longa TaxID=136217 RepID=UPI003D9E2557
MDGRDAMAMPGVVPYYIAHRGIPGSIAASQPGLHLAAQSLSIQSAGVGSGAFQVDSPPAASAHGGSGLGEGVNLVEPVKRKRGRPRKYGPDGAVALALSPSSLSAPSGTAGTESGSAPGAGTPAQKRGRGRPAGTGRKQQLASLGEWVAGSAGMRFTPHVITIAVGEDIATKIMSFSQQGPRAVCVLSANGAVSTVTLRQFATSGGTVTYEGRFEILCLSGSYMMTNNGGSRSRTGGLSISLSNTDGRVIGGGVAGVLIAATPVQVIIGSFIYREPKEKNKAKASGETNHDVEQTTSYASLPNRNLTASPIIGGWPGSRQLDLMNVNAHIDINLTRG